MFAQTHLFAVSRDWAQLGAPLFDQQEKK